MESMRWLFMCYNTISVIVSCLAYDDFVHCINFKQFGPWGIEFWLFYIYTHTHRDSGPRTNTRTHTQTQKKKHASAVQFKCPVLDRTESQLWCKFPMGHRHVRTESRLPLWGSGCQIVENRTVLAKPQTRQQHKKSKIYGCWWWRWCHVVGVICEKKRANQPIQGRRGGWRGESASAVLSILHGGITTNVITSLLGPLCRD